MTVPVSRLPQCVSTLENTLLSVRTRFRNVTASAEISLILEEVTRTPMVFPKI